MNATVMRGIRKKSRMRHAFLIANVNIFIFIQTPCFRSKRPQSIDERRLEISAGIQRITSLPVQEKWRHFKVEKALYRGLPHRKGKKSYK